jgi:hypothetical protein
MSNRTVLAWLAVAIALGFAAFFLLRGGGGSGAGEGGVVASGEKVLALEPARVVRLGVNRGQGDEVVSRAAGTDDWTLAAPSGTWPVSSARISAALRLLADMRAVGEAERGASVGDDATTVRVEQDDGTAYTLRMAKRTLAGAGLVSVEGGAPAGAPGADGTGTRLALVDDNVIRALREPGPGAWRATSVLAGFDQNPSGIRLESSAGVLALRRVENRWSVTEPMRAPADPAKVAGLMKSLGELAIADFLDAGPPAAPFVPSASIVLESGSGKRTVELGGPADASGKRLFARLDGTRIVSVDATSLTSVAMVPGAYIAGTATALAAPDVGTLVMSGSGGAVSRRLVREVDGWTEVMASGKGSLLSTEDRTGVNDAVRFLIERPATEVAIAAPKGYTPVGTLEIGGLDGGGIETHEIGVAEGPMLVIHSGPVYRSYPLAAAPAVLRSWAEPSAPKPAGAGGKPGEPMK